jgi:hypothetical protein
MPKFVGDNMEGLEEFINHMPSSHFITTRARVDTARVEMLTTSPQLKLEAQQGQPQATV